MQDMPEYEKIEIRPMSLGDILNRTFNLFGKHFLKLAIIVTLGSIVNWVYSIWMNDQMMSMFASMQDWQNARNYESFFAFYDDIGNMIGLNILGVVSAIFSVWMIGCLTHLVSVIHFEGLPVVSHSLKRGTQKLLKMIGVGLLLIIIMIVPGTVLGFIMVFSTMMASPILGAVLMLFVYFPAILYFTVRFIFIAQAVFIEDQGVMDSIKRSWNLTGGNWWRLFGFGVLTVIFNMAVTFTLGLIPFAGTILTSLVGTSIMIIFLTLVYWDIRARKETLSLEQIQAELDTSDAEPGLPLV